MISIRNLSKKYGKKEIFKNINFDIKEGEIFSIVGESGIGKSTFAKILAKIDKDYEGDIFINGENIKKIDNYYNIVQMVFQEPSKSFNPFMKIIDIVLEGIDIQKIKVNRKEYATKLLEKVGLSPSYLFSYPLNLSGGQMQRLAIARAISMNAKILVLDEPTSSLDSSIKGQIIDLIQKLNKELNITMVYISHDEEVIKYISNNVYKIIK